MSKEQNMNGSDASAANSTNSPNAGTSNEAAAAQNSLPRKFNVHEMSNQEFVSRLMAATPPYFYSAPVGPNNFFFSDMLRTLVQARHNENARNLQLQQQSLLARRPRKRTWSHHRSYFERRDCEEKHQQHQLHVNSNPLQASLASEKPLELTTNNNHQSKPCLNLLGRQRKLTETVRDLVEKKTKLAEAEQPATPAASNASELQGNNNPNTAVSGGGGAIDSANNTPPAASLPPQDLVLPPPPPVWYPPLYPPYGIDPLHFFIDLRVSGHIYDRKKDNVSPLAISDNASSQNNNNDNTDCDANNTNNNNTLIQLPNKHSHRHGSAFTVPVPRSNETAMKSGFGLQSAINLSANKFDNYAKYYDLGESKENQPLVKTGASYMLQHLPRLYSHFAARDLIGGHLEQSSASNSSALTKDSNNAESIDISDSKSDGDCEADSTDEQNSVENSAVDVEIIDSIKYRSFESRVNSRNDDCVDGNGDVDGESSHCSSASDASITQID